MLRALLDFQQAQTTQLCLRHERAKEHAADREKQAEDINQIKHWITSHEEWVAPPKFVFKIVKTFQDPLTCHLAEDVSIDLRREDILNSKAEYSRCRVPRLRVDMEGWKEKKKESMIVERAEQEITTTVFIHQEEQGDALAKEAEDRLTEKDNKRKKDEQCNPEGRKTKKRKLEKLE